MNYILFTVAFLSTYKWSCNMKMYFITITHSKLVKTKNTKFYLFDMNRESIYKYKQIKKVLIKDPRKQIEKVFYHRSF